MTERREVTATRDAGRRRPSSGPPGFWRNLPRVLTWSVGSEILRSAFLVFLILELLFGSIFLIKAVQDHGFDLVMILPFLWQESLYALYFVIPIALLFGTALVYGRLVADREVTACRSFGLSHIQLVLAPLIIGLFFASVGYFLNGYIVPEVRYARRNIGKIIADQLQYLGSGWDRQIRLNRENSIHIQEYDGGRLRGISVFAENPASVGLEGLFENSDAEQIPFEALSFPFFLHAESGEVRSVSSPEDATVSELVFELRGVTFFLDIDFDLFNTETPNDFLSHGFLSRLAIPIKTGGRRRGHKDMINPQMRGDIEEKRVHYNAVVEQFGGSSRRAAELAIVEARYRYVTSSYDYHRRFAYAAISLVFPLTAALLAMALQSSNRLKPFFLGVAVCCAVFFPIEMQSRLLARKLPGDPWTIAAVTAQLGNIVLLLLCVALFLRLERLWPFRGKRRRAAEADR